MGMQRSCSSAKRASGSFCRSAKNLDVQSIVRYPLTTKVRLLNLFLLNDSEIERKWQLDIIFFMTCHLTQELKLWRK